MKQKLILFLLILISGFANAQLPFTPKLIEMVCQKVNQWDIDPILVDSMKFTYDNNFSSDTSKLYTRFFNHGELPSIHLRVIKHTNSLSKVSDVLIDDVTPEDIRIFSNQLLEMGYKEKTGEKYKNRDENVYQNDTFYIEILHVLKKDSYYRSIGFAWKDHYPLLPKNQQVIRTSGCIYGDCMDGESIYKSDTLTYYGNYKTGMPDGFGKLTVNVGDLSKNYYYEGNFKSGMRHGYGKLITKSYSYFGNWYEDKKSGLGVLDEIFTAKPGRDSGHYENGLLCGEASSYKKDSKGNYRFEYKKRYRKGYPEDKNTTPDFELEASLNTILNDFENEFKNIKGKKDPDFSDAILSKVNLPGCKTGKIFHDNLSGHNIWKAIIPCDGTEDDARKKYDDMLAKLKVMPMDCCNFKDEKEESSIEYYTVRTPYVLMLPNKIYNNLRIKINALKLQSDNKWVVNFYIYYQDGN